MPASLCWRPLRVVTALAFALWPLGRAHDVPVSALFRDAVAPERRWPRLRYVVGDHGRHRRASRASQSAFAYERRIALIFVASAAGTFVALRLIAALVMAVARRLPRSRSMAVRLAVANIHRPGALTPTVVLSLGLGSGAAGDGDADRRQFAAPIERGAARARALLLLPRHPAGRRRALRRAGRAACARRQARPRTHAARAHRQREPHPRRGCEGAAAGRLGAAGRSRHHLCGDDPGRLADRRRGVVAGGLRGHPARLAGEADRRRAGPHRRRSAHGQRAGAQHRCQGRQPARGRLAVAGDQLRPGLFARQLSAGRRTPRSPRSPSRTAATPPRTSP